MANLSNLPTNRNFYTISELAETWRVSEVHVGNLVKRGLLPATRIGRRIIICREDAENFIQRNATNARAVAA